MVLLRITRSGSIKSGMLEKMGRRFDMAMHDAAVVPWNQSASRQELFLSITEICCSIQHVLQDLLSTAYLLRHREGAESATGTRALRGFSFRGAHRCILLPSDRIATAKDPP